MEAVLIVFIIFGSIASLILVPSYLKSRERSRLHDTLKASIEHAQPIPAEVIEAITSDVKIKAPASPMRDLRTGIIWLGVAVGLAAFGFAISFEEPDALYPLIGMAAFPGFIGLAFIAISFFGRGK